MKAKGGRGSGQRQGMEDRFLREFGVVWRGKRGTPFAKFLLDAFTGNGILAIYEMSDAQILKHLKSFYKHSNRSNPLKGGQ